jgi:hypothetical protein
MRTPLHPLLRRTALLIAALMLACIARAQDPTASLQFRLADDDVTLRLGGTAQVRAAYARESNPIGDAVERVGFGVRRLRARAYVDIGPRVNLFIQGEGASSGATLLDLRATYKLSRTTSVRAGRFVLAQPASFGRTIHYHIDAVERPVAAREWASLTVGPDGRDFGVELYHKGPQVRARVALHNGDGSWDRATGNFREDVGVGSATRESDRSALAVSGSVSYRVPLLDGLDVGAYASLSGGNARTVFARTGRGYASYAAHVYWGRLPGSQPVRIKLDVVGIQYDELALGSRLVNDHFAGGALFGAVRLFGSAEVFARYDLVEAVGDTRSSDIHSTFYTVGGSFSASALAGRDYHRDRVTLGWTGRFDEDHDGLAVHGATLQAQLVF